jgi:hypothetical protein
MKYNVDQDLRLLSTHHFVLLMWLEADKLAVTCKDKEK